MVIRELDSGRDIHEDSRVAYDDEVLNAGWAEVPEVSAGNPAPAEAHQLPNDREVDAFLARLYAAQE